MGDDVLRWRGLVIGDVPDLAVEAPREHEAGNISDIIDMRAIEHLARLDDPPRLAAADIDQRVAAGAIDAGEAQDVRVGPSGPSRRRPARLVLEPRPAAGRSRPRRACLVDPFAGVVAVHADGRIVDDAPQRRRGGDDGPEAIDPRPCPVARRDRDDNRLGRPKRLLQPGVRVGPVKLIGFDPLATQRGHGLRAPRRSDRLDPGLALNEAAGAIAEAEEEDPQAVRNAAFGSGITRPTDRASSSQLAMASSTLRAASSRVSPSDMQPGRSGTVATKPLPSSSASGWIIIRLSHSNSLRHQ